VAVPLPADTPVTPGVPPESPAAPADELALDVALELTLLDVEPLAGPASAAAATAASTAALSPGMYSERRRRPERSTGGIYPPGHASRLVPMASKQRQVRLQQQFGPATMEEMQSRSDEQLEAETKFRSAALAILGGRAAERYDADAARSYFQRAIAAARPQERMQIRRMADASLALAERRAGDLRDAVQKLGQEPPTSRQLFGLRVMGIIAPGKRAGILARLRGIGAAVLIVIAILAIGAGVVELISLPFGGFSLPPAVLLGLLLDIAVIAVLIARGRSKRNKARSG
jgi:hypothetical protein